MLDLFHILDTFIAVFPNSSFQDKSNPADFTFF